MLSVEYISPETGDNKTVTGTWTGSGFKAEGLPNETGAWDYVACYPVPDSKDSHIDFGANCEIQIAGSGDGRYNFGYTGGENTERFKLLDGTLMRERGGKERDNQRFVIHIIPKNIIDDAENAEKNNI